jgi:hypothetical protein
VINKRMDQTQDGGKGIMMQSVKELAGELGFF